MKQPLSLGHRKWVAGVLAIGLVGAAVVTKLVASDHQQTSLTELNPRTDITDMYAFPGGAGNASADRITLVMVTSSPLTPAQSAGAKFDPNLLYQFKIDNNGNGVEDLVIQVTFDSTANNERRIVVRGPMAPPSLMDPLGTPIARGGAATILLSGTPNVTGNTDVVLAGTGSNSDISVFAGVRDDPFFVDLEQFFRIIPDRKPVTGPLAALPETPTASRFRGPNPPFAGGTPVNFLAGINALAIAIELPESRLTAGGGAKLGVWGTISR